VKNQLSEEIKYIHSKENKEKIRKLLLKQLIKQHKAKVQAYITLPYPYLEACIDHDISNFAKPIEAFLKEMSKDEVEEVFFSQEFTKQLDKTCKKSEVK
jgi:hypothetical protein